MSLKVLTYDGLCERLVLQGGEAEVADLDGAGGACDEDVVALQVAVDDRRGSRVQEVETFDDLPTPGLQDSLVDLLESPKVGFQGAGSHQLGDQNDTFL
jgi:hypothetical protein